MKFHPNDLAIEEFYLALDEEHQLVLQHLTGCARCRELLQEVISLPRRVGSAANYSDVIQRVEDSTAAKEKAVSKERAEAPALFVELMRLTSEQQRLLIRNSPRFRTWGLFELLLERSLATAFKDPTGAEALALLALEVSIALDSACYCAGAIQDMRARAWAYLGNARRLKSDFEGASDAFARAETSLRNGSRDPVEEAIVLDLKASLLRAKRQFVEALEILNDVVATFLRHGHPHRAGRSLVNMDMVHRYAGNPDLGIPLLFQAVDLIDPDLDLRLVLCAWHNLIDDLTETGRFLEAQRVYRETLPLYRDFPDNSTQNRRKWVKGKISLGLGQIERAEALFIAAREGFIAESTSYDAALISLDLALLYARQGRTADLKRLAEEMFPIFSSLKIQREALAALAFLRQALDAEKATVEAVSQVADFLRRAEYDPALCFETVPG